MSEPREWTLWCSRYDREWHVQEAPKYVDMGEAEVIEKSAYDALKTILRELTECWVPVDIHPGRREYTFKKDPPNETGFYESQFIIALAKARAAVDRTEQ